MAPTVSLANDTGSASNDAITQDGTLDVSGLAPGAVPEYSIDNGTTWNDSFNAAEGLNTVLVRQTIGGSSSDGTNFEFILDTTAPKPPRVDLADDTGGSAVDHVTQNGSLVLTNVESDAKVEYSTNGGVSWIASFNAVEGVNTVKVRQTDVSGNISDAALLSFLLDTSPPAVPGVALAADTGASPTDLITNDATLALSDVEQDSAVEYSLDGGTTWDDILLAIEGANTVHVRQTDVAGNVSGVTTQSFVLDTTPPKLNPTFSTGNASLLVNQKDVTVAPNASDELGIASQSAGLIDTATAGAKTVNCTATDIAGNVTSVMVPYTVGYAFVDVQPPSGGSYLAKRSLTVSFQLADANGIISDSTAELLRGGIVVVLDGEPAGTVKYNKKTDRFAVDLPLKKLAPGSHDLEIVVTANGTDVAATSLSFFVVPSKWGLKVKI
jgi:hypothetical protein